MKKLITYSFLSLFLALILWAVWANTALELSVYEIGSPNIPETFDGWRIAHISDLHNAQLGEDNGRLLALLEKAAPDIIVITGDLVDCHHTDLELAVSLAGEAMKIAPCFYVTGNHEATLADDEYLKLEDALSDRGVKVLHDEALSMEKDGQSVRLIGIDDPEFGEKKDRAEALQSLSVHEAFNILLTHRPELFEKYCAAGIDLVFGGHAHGGQFRIPFVGGLYAPGQGLLPEYDAGLYADGDTQMILSRGIGNSLIPLRFNNRPELILAILHAE